MILNLLETFKTSIYTPKHTPNTNINFIRSSFFDTIDPRVLCPKSVFGILSAKFNERNHRLIILLLLQYLSNS